MARVQVLPDVLAHQIAAGEVIERPAAVVKELLENSLDATASRVSVEVTQGGIQLIQVSDDGIGMSREDARLAFEHHATSKIVSFEDLARISTLGFRGEALPSIASVARVRLRTVERGRPGGNYPVGTEISYEGGRLLHVRDSAWPAGTEVIVEDLFFNVPARRKFLKSVATELSHISRQVMNYALAYPEVEFRLTHQSRSLVEAPRVATIQDRIFQVLGDSFLDNLVPLDHEEDGVRITGYSSLPHEQRGNANFLFLFVNRRMVKDRVLTHAIRFAYQDLIPSSAFPISILFVGLDPSEVDVNVHPSKTEIRFRDSQRVHHAISKAIERALIQGKTSLSSLARPLESPLAGPGAPGSRVASSLERFFLRSQSANQNFESIWSGAQVAGPSSAPAGQNYAIPAGMTLMDYHGDAVPETCHISPIPVVLGQLAESFIVATDREGVLLIDQHVAHERILYDQALRFLGSAQPVPTQRLLIPRTIDLDPQQIPLAEELIDHLNSGGFEVEWFGQRTLVVKGLPGFAGDSDASRIVEDLLAELKALDRMSSADGRKARRIRERLAISLACRAAIKINTPLNGEKIQWLLDELFRCENPYTCPHGRPIVLRLNLEEILRGFKRI